MNCRRPPVLRRSPSMPAPTSRSSASTVPIASASVENVEHPPSRAAYSVGLDDGVAGTHQDGAGRSHAPHRSRQAQVAAPRWVKVSSVVLKPPFARCSTKPSTPAADAEQPLDEVRRLRTSGARSFQLLEAERPQHRPVHPSRRAPTNASPTCRRLSAKSTKKVQLDCCFVGRLSGTQGTVWQYTAIGVASRSAGPSSRRRLAPAASHHRQRLGVPRQGVRRRRRTPRRPPTLHPRPAPQLRRLCRTRRPVAPPPG